MSESKEAGTEVDPQEKIRQEIERTQTKRLDDYLARKITKEEYLNLNIDEILRLKSKNQELEEKAGVDALTGLSNKRRFDEDYRKAYESLRRSPPEGHESEYEEHGQMALLFIDGDRFKLVNDRFGHGVGNIVLQNIAKALGMSAARLLDTVARYGGEEFVIVLPHTGETGALKVATKINENYATLQNEAGFPKLDAIQTLSIGIAVGDSASDPDELLEYADKAMYVAKETGKAEDSQGHVRERGKIAVWKKDRSEVINPYLEQIPAA